MDYNLFYIQMKMVQRYEKAIVDLNRQIDDIIYKFAGVRAIQYDKQRMTFNKYIADEVLERMYQELKQPQKELDEIQNAMYKIRPMVVDKLLQLPKDVQQMCISIMWQNKTYEYVGERFGYTASGVRKRIVREVNKL